MTEPQPYPKLVNPVTTGIDRGSAVRGQSGQREVYLLVRRTRTAFKAMTATAAAAAAAAATTTVLSREAHLAVSTGGGGWLGGGGGLGLGQAHAYMRGRDVPEAPNRRQKQDSKRLPRRIPRAISLNYPHAWKPGAGITTCRRLRRRARLDETAGLPIHAKKGS